MIGRDVPARAEPSPEPSAEADADPSGRPVEAVETFAPARLGPPFAKRAKWTAGLLILASAGALVLVNGASSAWAFVPVAVVVGLWVVLLVLWGHRPFGVMLTPEHLVVGTASHGRRIRHQHVEAARRLGPDWVDRMGRHTGPRPVFYWHGDYRHEELGAVRVFAASPAGCVFLQIRYTLPVVVSLADPDGFLRRLGEVVPMIDSHEPRTPSRAPA